jgi:hypothetical protein
VGFNSILDTTLESGEIGAVSVKISFLHTRNQTRFFQLIISIIEEKIPLFATYP